MSSKRLFTGRQYLGRQWEPSLFRGVGDAEESVPKHPAACIFSRGGFAVIAERAGLATTFSRGGLACLFERGRDNDA